MAPPLCPVVCLRALSLALAASKSCNGLAQLLLHLLKAHLRALQRHTCPVLDGGMRAIGLETGKLEKGTAPPAEERWEQDRVQQERSQQEHLAAQAA